MLQKKRLGIRPGRMGGSDTSSRGKGGEHVFGKGKNAKGER